MTAVAAPDAWMEAAIVTVTELSNATRHEFAALTEGIDIDQGEKQAERIALVNGGSVFKTTPQGDTMVTLEMYPIEIGTFDDNKGIQQLFDYQITEDTTDPIKSDSSSLRRANVQVAIMWTTDVQTSASSAVDADERGLRFQMVNAHIVSVKTAFTDGILKTTAVFKAPPTNKAGTANLRWESTDGSSSPIAVFSGTYAGVLQ